MTEQERDEIRARIRELRARMALDQLELIHLQGVLEDDGKPAEEPKAA